MRFLRLALMTAILVAGTGAAATAAPLTFSNRAAWTAAATGITTVTFEGIAPFGNFVPLGSGPATIDGVTFSTGPATFLFVVDPAFGPAFYDWGSGAVLNFDFGNPNTMTATLPASMSAVGFDVMTFQPYAATVTIQIASGGVATFSVPTADFPIRTFFGIVADSSITSVTITGNSLGVNVDNFAYGKAGTGPPPHIPEASTLAMLGIGLMRLRAGRRRQAR